MKRNVVRLPLPGKVARCFRQGYNTCPQSPAEQRGKITWEQWVSRKYR